jgi:opacity protein-like surface antigen
MMLAVVLLGIGSGSEVEARRKWGAGIMFREDQDFGVQARYSGGRIGKRLGLVVQGGYFFDNEFADFSADLHLPIKVSEAEEEGATIYALGGANLLTDFDETEFGFNLGAGADYPLGASLAGYGEIKYVFSDADGFALQLGVHF